MKKMRGPRGISGLQKLIDDCCGGILVEIGCFAGESSELFAKSGKFNQIYCVDPWDGVKKLDLPSFAQWYYDYDMNAVEKAFDKRMKPYPFVTKIRKTSQQASLIVGEVDMVYIDAIHSYEGVLMDIEAWRGKIRTGGWICGHDCSERFSGVIRAVYESLGQFLLYDDTSWAVKI